MYIELSSPQQTFIIPTTA